MDSEGTNFGISELYAESLNPNSLKTITSSSTEMEFVLIPSGKFKMGSSLGEKERYYKESPVHEVIINKSFYLGKYPVTQKQWKIVMSDNPSKYNGENNPVERVSWYDVQEFIKKLNENDGIEKYRLPSEAEWEYACRAGTPTKYYFGDDYSKLKDYGWFSGYATYEECKKNMDKLQNQVSTHQVGMKTPNKWNLYDMHGNVWEWVQDRSHMDYDGAPSDGSAWEDGYSSDRVIRGGCCALDAENCTSTTRNGEDAESRIKTLGFRLLREI